MRRRFMGTVLGRRPLMVRQAHQEGVILREGLILSLSKEGTVTSPSTAQPSGRTGPAATSPGGRSRGASASANIAARAGDGWCSLRFFKRLTDGDVRGPGEEL